MLKDAMTFKFRIETPNFDPIQQFWRQFYSRNQILSPSVTYFRNYIHFNF